MTLASISEPTIQSFITQLSQHFKICDLGPTTQPLGIKIDRDCSRHSISLSQRQYCLDVLNRFGMANLLVLVISTSSYESITYYDDLPYLLPTCFSFIAAL